MVTKVNIEQNLADTIIERPHGFKVGSRQFYLYQITLGKSYLLNRLIENLDINKSIIGTNPFLEVLRLSYEKKNEALRIITYHTLEGKEVLDNEKVEERMNFLSENLSNEDIAQLLMTVLNQDNVSEYLKYLKIDKEKDAQAKVMKCKDENKNVYSFGGKSVYGTLIDYFAQRYGWPMDYILWGISYNNLQMLMSDAVTTIHLSDNEAKRCRVSHDRNFISGDDVNNIEKIKKLFGG